MPRHFEREIDCLKRSLLVVGAAVEENVQKAMLAVRRRDIELARQVIEADHEIDRLEVQTEEECLKALALYQPVAQDLRFVVAALKMTDELERMGDLAANIAKRAISLAERPSVALVFEFDDMATRTVWMVKQALSALIERDTELAREVWLADDAVDAIHAGAQVAIKQALRANPADADQWVDWLVVERFTERLADQAKSIAKDVLYMVEGEIVRHQGDALRAARVAREAAE